MGLIVLSNEQKLIENEIRKFSQTELEPIANEIDKKGVFPVESIKKLSNLGLSGLIIPEEYGGAGMDTTSLCIVLEELSKVCASISTILAVNNCLVAFPVLEYATQRIKEDCLKKLADGTIGGYSIHLKMDLSSTTTEVKKSNSTYSISGKHDFVLNGETARFCLMPVLLNNSRALYILERSKGIEVKKRDILGLRAAGVVSFAFNDIQLMAENCLVSGKNAEGAFHKIQDYTKIGFSAISLGIAEAAYDASIKYSKERKQFGRAICEFPMVQEMLVDIKTKIEAARFLVYNAAARCDDGQNYSLDARIARLHSGEAAVFSGSKAVQVHGGYGYTKDYPVERYLWDAKAIQVLNETPHDLKTTIAKELLV